jgi:tetratricopeptide (TPR) repeat protein
MSKNKSNKRTSLPAATPKPTALPRPAAKNAATIKVGSPNPGANTPAIAGNPVFWLAVVIGITAIVMWAVNANDFVNWDDYPYLLENELVMKPFSLSNVWAILKQTINGNWNPLPIVMYHIEYQFVELKPWLYHVNNWWLHLLVTGLAFQLARRLGLSLPAAALAGLLFGIHPMRVESVAWVTERKDVLFGTFYMLALLLYLRQRQNPIPPLRYWAMILPVVVLGMMSKIQFVSLPLSMLCIDYWLGRPLNFRLILEKWIFFALSLATGLVGVYFLKDAGTIGEQTTDFGLGGRLLIGAYSYCVYIMKSIWPYEMSPLYPYPNKLSNMFYIAPIGVAAVAAAVFYGFVKNWRAWVFSIAFFTVNVMFMLQIVGAGQGFIADRFTYMGYFGLFFLAAWAVQHLCNTKPNLRPAVMGITALYLVACGYVANQQIGIWKDGVALWGHVLKYYKQVTTPYNNRGEVYRKRGDLDLALMDYDTSIAMKPNAPALNSRGMIYVSKGRPDLAIKDYEQALSLDTARSMQAEVRINMGGALGLLKRIPEAKQFLDQGLALDTVNKLGYKNRYLAHLDLQMFDLALKDVNRYLELEPTVASSWVDKGAILRTLNRNTEALEAVNKGISMVAPNDAQMALFLLNRAMIYEQMGNRDAMIKDAREAQQRGMNVDPKMLQ